MAKCSNCNAELLPGQPTCAYCGAALPPPPQPAPAPFAPQAYRPPPQPAQPYAPPQPYRPMPTGPVPPFMAWALVGLLSTFFLGNPTGMFGGIFAFIAKSSWDSGNQADAMSKLRISKILTILGFVGMGAFFVLIVFLSALGSM